MELQRLTTFKEASTAKDKVFNFDGLWADAFGTPQRTGVWFIYGNSGHGKTTFVMQLIVKLTQYSRVLFVSYEEGLTSASLQETARRTGLTNVKKRAWICIDTLAELNERLERKRSADVIVIDSLEHSEITKIEQVVELSRKFKNKLFIFIGQADGNLPMGRLGHDVLHFANQKIQVEGYRAVNRGRSMGTINYWTIWAEQAEIYHSK
ncbi:MAG: AAA family ATPase [Holosporales bacterium]|jgi:nucleoside-triphosphatase THEP1|nr:AAA family ATPase [Holosporales bacterium]